MAYKKDLSLLASAGDVEKRFLAGPRDRAKDLESAIRYFLEFIRGFETLGDIDRPCAALIRDLFDTMQAADGSSRPGR